MRKLARQTLICIDPGHAKNTPGKRAGNPVFYEYEGNRRVARKLRTLLERAGFRVMYSCDLNNPNDLSLEGRARAARNAGADLFISIHTNAVNDTSVRGTETFIHTNSKASEDVARAVQDCLVKAIGQRNRGVKRANFGVLRNTYQHMLSILTEADFFTNPTARQWMFQESFDYAYAQAVAQGVCDYYKVEYPSDVIESKPVQDKTPVPEPIVTEDVGAAIVRVKANELWVYNKPDWNARYFTVKKDEAFTVMKELMVNDHKMYQLKSGLFITANTKYVELDGRVEAVSKNPATGTTSQSIRPYPGYPIRLTSPQMRDTNGRTDIQAVQRAVKVNPDGWYGPISERAVRNYQTRQGLIVDGIVGPQTWNHMF
ncbi:N-acetylmuramoyl-L-alanine amidase [Alkalihalobacillus sp. LMS39]|uniref:N-acetylmuramoyl-L-alanine amidase n=1 Tax=Alkalihalobacillus sp. LMS39 TaxID=2924032 RepID=UPI001FB560AF|nr:N-acetylmuramoyl-L-alanine amidase [Alkalihalobacillus sp. LMS39]UOE96084.1 N-acetylmuramoyl-L-alanine amidase [Alkalihalobacillus sp. LMS39]